MKLAEMNLLYQITILKEKLKFAQHLISKLDKIIRDSELSEEQKGALRNYCSDLEMFMQEK